MKLIVLCDFFEENVQLSQSSPWKADSKVDPQLGFYQASKLEEIEVQDC